jgi:bifunctional DNA-binding transcriptional regulator/antitoxin component of YhaV-PrlF toxin-antitoxin module
MSSLGNIRGIVRELDILGRVCIPIDYRKSLDIHEDTALDLTVVDKVIHLKVGRGRKLDALGRYTIPVEVRRSLRFEMNEKVDIYIENEEVCIKRVSLHCAICNTDDESCLMDVDGVLICRSCGMKVIDKFMEVIDKFMED